eukprot:TRINITY_DN2722_c0_g1_i2.p4 TRINITY_DN2722_c0_g1~~TRINITY_DN2722_c0_g1_i2.p4  ORF type:complete len:134 (-),score=63.15 TRINITY_DN2722_c0_g1_i2:52-453(-)
MSDCEWPRVFLRCGVDGDDTAMATPHRKNTRGHSQSDMSAELDAGDSDHHHHHHDGDHDDDVDGGVVLLGGLQHENKKRQKRIVYAAETAARDIMRALRPNTPILALDVDRATLIGAARLPARRALFTTRRRC